MQRWQHRLEPVQKRVFGDCHLTRDTPALQRAAGFEVRELDRYYEKGSPNVVGPHTLGVAASP